MTLILSGTAGVTSVNGTAAAPSVTGTDTDTGIVYGTNTLSLATGGTSGLTMDSSQNVGIGTSSPNAKLNVNNGFLQVDISGTQTVRLGSSDSIIGGTSNNAVIQANTSKATIFLAGGTEQARWNAGAPILCLSGGNTSATGTGITFPATQSASSDANTLDDYEEGTWTPTISGDGTNFSGTTYGATAGLYTKVGRTVWVSFDINVSTAGTLNTAGATISGLPFSIPNYGDLRNGGGGIGYITSIQSNYVYQSCYPQNSSAYLYIIGRTAASTSTIPPAANAFYANSIRITGYAWWNI